MSFHSYRGQASTRPQQAGGTWSQARTRHGQTSFDQHGRKFSFSADNKNGMPTSIISPDGWSAPWYADQQYLRVNPDNPSELYVDYPAMYAPRKAAISGYHKEAVRYAQRKSLPVPKKGGPYSVEITEAIGEPPRALELIAAAAQGHPWVLGFSETPDPRLVQFIEATSADLEAELDDFDFSPESYADIVRGAKPATRRATPARSQPKKFTSLAELEAAAAETESDEERDEREEMERAARENAIEELQGTGATAGDEDLEALGIVDDLASEPPETVPTNSEGDELDELLDLEEQHDAEARGGQRIDPRKQDIASRQVSRRPTQTAKRKHGGARSAGTTAAPEKPKASSGGKAWDPDKAKGKSLADGAKPYVGG